MDTILYLPLKGITSNVSNVVYEGGIKLKLKPKVVVFDYYEVWCHQLDPDGDKINETKYDLTSVWTKGSKLTAKETMRKFREEKARIQKVELKKDIWEIQLLRLREKSLPGVAKDDGDYQIIKLEDGEYIGESNSLLYEKKHCILVMQRNYNGFTPSGVEDYLTSLFSPESEIKQIILKPIISGSKLDKIKKDKLYRSLIIGVAIGKDKLVDTPLLGKLLKEYVKYEGASYKIKISLGNVKRDRTLSTGLTVDTIREIYGQSCVTELKTSVKTSEDTKAEIVDLLNDRRQDSVELLVDKNTPLTHERVYSELEKAYLKRKKKNTIY